MRLIDLIEQHKLIRRLVLLWAVVLITWVVVKTWISPPDISGSTATALSVVVGLLATAIGFYKWSRHKEGEQ